MKIGILSDIHCNVRGLLRALEGMGQVDAIFCAGDAVYGYRFSNEVYDIIRERRMYMVMGNHDWDILRTHGDTWGANGKISPENLVFLKSLPRILEVNLNGKRILMTHGTPFEPNYEYVYRHSEKFQKLKEIPADIIILGHTHIVVVERVGHALVINPGSCGEARDPQYPFQLTYAVLDLETEEVQICAFDDPDQSRGAIWEPQGPLVRDSSAPEP